MRLTYTIPLLKGQIEKEIEADKKETGRMRIEAQQRRGNKENEWKGEQAGERHRVKLKGLDSSFSLNSLITSSHSGLRCHGNVYMTPYPAEAKTGMAHIMLNPMFTWHNPSQTNTVQPATWKSGRQLHRVVGHLLMERETNTCICYWHEWVTG